MSNGRLQQVVLGTLAGLCLHLLDKVLTDPAASRLAMSATVLVVTFFGAALAMAGEVRLRAALTGAMAIALPVAGLMALKSLAFPSVEQFLEAGHTLFAGFVLAAISVPFLMTVGQQGRRGLLDYAALFLNAWNIVVRYAAAVLFLGVVWAVLAVSAALLNLVGLSFLDRALEEPVVIWMISGAVLGLGLSVVTEMSDLIAPDLVLRLLRLLLPVVLIVVAVFVAALPLRGLAGLFGEFSPTAILIAVAVVAVSLISIAVDRDDIEAEHGRVLGASARLLCLFVLVLGVMAGWALVARVEQHGWTPLRVSAVAAVAVVLGYGAFYALALLSGRNWMARVRQANLAMAGAQLVLAAVWLTPLIGPEAISTRSQLARYEARVITADQLPLWEFAHSWGLPGAEALQALATAAAASGEVDLARRLEAVNDAAGPWDPQLNPLPESGLRDRLATEMPVLPEGKSLPAALLEDVPDLQLQDWAGACARATPQGYPGCLVILADLLPQTPGDEAVILLNAGWGQSLRAAPVYVPSGSGWRPGLSVVPLEGADLTDGALIDAIRAAGLQVVPSGVAAIRAGNQFFTILP